MKVQKIKRLIESLTQEELLLLAEIWDSKKDVPKSLKKLSLAQANYWAKVYDALKESGKDESSAAKIAWMQTKKKYSLKF